jgi:hypothetical protein
MRPFSEIARSLRSGRRKAVIAAAVATMLVTAGAALAFHGFSSAGTVTATFVANTAANSQSQTCTAANNDSIQISEATFTGTATSADTHLNGPITIDARSVYDATTNAGSVTADVSTTGGFEGRLIAVNVKGQLQGFLVGEESGGGQSGGGQVLGNLSSSFSTTAGFGSSSTPATIGTGTGMNTAIVSTSSCASSHDQGEDTDNDDDNGQGGNWHHLSINTGHFGAGQFTSNARRGGER